MDDPEAAVMRVLYDEHAAAIWRYAVRLTGDQARAEDVVQETLLRAWQHPEVTRDSERSPRAWLFTVARNLIIDDQRSARSRNESGTPDLEQWPIAPARMRWTPHWTDSYWARRSASCPRNTARSSAGRTTRVGLPRRSRPTSRSRKARSSLGCITRCGRYD